ncbi:MAG: thioredoxin domain-containing protein [Methanomicrobiales archaeon]
MPSHENKGPAGKKGPQRPNRLSGESSPYLLQHAYNPVEWYPWGDEAFQLAKVQDRPVFLSVGYSTCHWCHVMAHESFEDGEVAALLNRAFICIKVDREERPDIDALYISVAQALTGSGGWPLTIIMTPEKEPFFAATYIPKESRFGSNGLIDLIPAIETFWKTRRGDIRETVEKITRALQHGERTRAGQPATETLLHAAYHDLALRFDAGNGGFSSAPKFPTPHTISFLLRYWRRTGKENALAMADKTLHAMSAGGMYDHLGYGFHRYSTDSTWLVPHFEKMLYDQALLVTAYTEAYLATGTMSFRTTAEEVLTYLLRDMHDPKGGFFSAEDADSEGIEGKFYLWRKREVEEVLGDDAPAFISAYNVKSEGNFSAPDTGKRTGENILHLTASPEQLAKIARVPEEEYLPTLSRTRERLFAYRKNRVPPLRDDKVLTDWNGLVISALSRAARAFGNPWYMEAATGAADFILATMRSRSGELFHRYRDGQVGIRGVASDYAYFCAGLLDLYELTCMPEYLEAAIGIEEYFTNHFLDGRTGGYFTSHEDEAGLLVRQKEIYDGALPSVNSIAMKNLVRLGLMTTNKDYHARAWDLAGAFSTLVERSPSAYTEFLSSLDFALGPAASVVIVGDARAPGTVAMNAAINSRYFPSLVVLHRPGGDGPFEIDRISGFTGEMKESGGKATAYICKNHACSYPAIDADTMAGELEKMYERRGSRFPLKKVRDF